MDVGGFSVGVAGLPVDVDENPVDSYWIFDRLIFDRGSLHFNLSQTSPTPTQVGFWSAAGTGLIFYSLGGRGINLTWPLFRCSIAFR